MYESLLVLDRELEPLLRGHDPALFHAGDYRRVLRVHERHAALTAVGGHAGLPPVGPLLMRRLGDARTMYAALVDLLRRGGRAPGPNGHRLDELEVAERWPLCRELARSVRDGTYRPGPGRKVEVPKEGKPGESRELTVRDAEDRMVGRALVRVLRPVVEPAFSPFSFGFRPGRGTLAALATARALAELSNRWVWVAADIEKAFDRVHLGRLLDACRRHFPQDVVRFIALISDTGRKGGQRQGSPESPLLFNVFADHFIDRPWRRYAETPLVRYADDLLLVCGTVDAAAVDYEALSRLARSAGLPLKGAAAESIFKLGEGRPVEWLGYRLSRESGGLAVRIAQAAWRRLQWRLAKAHLLPASPLRAVQIVRGWLGYLGPCYPFEDRRAVVGRVRDVAAGLAFDEIPGRETLLRWWRDSHARWLGVYTREAAALPSRLQWAGEPAGGG